VPTESGAEPSIAPIIVAEVKSAPTGIVLAGGRGRRMGAESKPGADLGGRPMMAWPLAALAAVCDRCAVVAKQGTILPVLPKDVERWDEPERPRHPLTGLVCALERAGGPVLVCAADMPFVTTVTLVRIVDARGDAAACVGRADGRLQPLLAAYAPTALDTLRAAEQDAPLKATVWALDPVVIDVPEGDAVSVDTPEALERARLSPPDLAAG
jgi:molybdopterin-guanine dinucleotide biosynthesis protein A